ncbi:MAG: NAD(P)/FAD-dependent oxidoreductase [Anaerolineae bacterium]|jgi:phytoene dehydrogenase-like protein
MPAKSIIIIGAGMSGLSAGCYGQMNGYRTQVFEMHNKTGGVCTSWKRKGYTIGTAGWLTGAAPENNDYHGFWRELGAVQGQSFVSYEEYVRIEGRDGQVLTLYSDIDRLERHLHDLAPEDKETIDGLIKTLRGFTRFRMDQSKPPELYSFFERLRMMVTMLPAMLGPQGKWMKMTLRDLANEFQNPFLREALGKGALHVLFFDDSQGAMMLLSFLAQLHLKTARYPVGGLQKVVDAIEQRYRDLGGEIHFKSRVAEILVETDPAGRGDRAIGVRLSDGTEHRADIVISAADGRTTIFDMLDGKYVSDKIRGYYDNPLLFPPLLFVSLGVARAFEKGPPSVGGDVCLLAEPITVTGKEWNRLAVHVYDFDPTVAPEGGTLLRLWLPTDFDYWKNLREEDRKRYRAEKQAIADEMIARLDRRYPGLADQVEMIDVATPATFERYTGNWRASYMGWLYTPEMMMAQMDKTLPGLDNFYLVGQWAGGSSLPMAATSGRHVTQIICHKDNKPFVTTVP